MKITIVLAALLAGCGAEQVQQTAQKEPVSVQPKIVFMGDSIVARWQLPASIENAGIGGNTTVAMLARFDVDVLAKKPELVILEGGVNDLDREWPPADIANNMAALVIQAQASGARVVMLACLPTKYPHIKAAELNVELKLVAAAYGVTFVDTYAPFMTPVFRDDLLVDGVHPNEAGYTVLWALLADHVHEAK